jgi:hypothetical protein
MYTRSLLKTRLVDRFIKIEIPLIFIVKEQLFYQIEIKEIMALEISFICRKFSPAEGFMLVCLILMANINLL